MALTGSQKNAIRLTIGLIRDFAQSAEFEKWRIANQRLNGVENLKAATLADIHEMDLQLSELSQGDWDDICSLVGGVEGAIDGHFAVASKVAGFTI